MKEFLGEFFKDIQKRELKRDENMLYTLGDEHVDKFLYLDQNVATLSPDSGAIKNFAAVSYLFGMLGMPPINYTAVPSGFLVTYKNKEQEEVCTLLVMDEENPYFEEVIINYIKEKLHDETLSEDEKEILKETARLIRDEKVPLIEVVTRVEKLIQEKEEKKQPVQNLRKGILASQTEFDCLRDEETKKATTINQQNCDDNHVVLWSICAKLLGFKSDTENEQEKQQIQALNDSILNDWILKNYRVYADKAVDENGNKVPQNKQILNEEKVIAHAKGNFVTHKNACLILNMCSTDYAADIVFAIMKSITGSTKEMTVEEMLNKIQTIMPNTEQNFEQKRKARNDLIEMYGVIGEEFSL